MAGCSRVSAFHVPCCFEGGYGCENMVVWSWIVWGFDGNSFAFGHFRWEIRSLICVRLEELRN